MKIIQVLPELNAGGVERGTLEIASFLAREGHEAVVVSNGGRMVEALERSGARHIALPVHRKHPATLLQVLPLRRLLEKEKPDILHVRSRVPAWVAWLAWRGMRPESRPRLVTTVHGFYSVNRYSAIMTRGERVIAVSKSVRSYVLENYPSTSESVIRVIPRGLSLEDYHPGFRPPADWLDRWNAGRPELAGKHVLLLPGRITRLKGHEEFFRLIGSLTELGLPVHGLVAGDTHPKKKAYREELDGMVRSLGISDRVTFLGHRSDLREIMTVSDIVCALSRQPESFGRTVLEAMALRKPVVGFDCGGVGELLGILFPAGRVPLGDQERLLEATREVLEHRPLPGVVGAPFTLEAMCRSTLDVYSELVERRRE